MGCRLYVGVGGDSHIQCLVKLKRMSAVFNYILKREIKISSCNACLHARKVQQLAISCSFPLSMLCVMLNSGVAANLVLAVLFISVQARSIHNQGKLNCFSAVFSLG